MRKSISIFACVAVTVLFVGCSEDSARKPSSEPAPATPAGPVVVPPGETPPGPGGENPGPTVVVDGPEMSYNPGEVTTIAETRFKKVTTIDYTKDPVAKPDEYCRIAIGSKISIVDIRKEQPDEKYWNVKLKTAPAGCSFTEGFFYKAHVKVTLVHQ